MTGRLAQATRNEQAAEKLLAEIHQLFAMKTLFQWASPGTRTTRSSAPARWPRSTSSTDARSSAIAVARAYWGNGYGSEAAGAVIRYAFKTLDLHRLEADVDPRNHASIRCLQRPRLPEGGYARERYHLYGTVHDAVLYGLLRRELPVDVGHDGR